jgi:hypothetical protein
MGELQVRHIRYRDADFSGWIIWLSSGGRTLVAVRVNGPAGSSARAACRSIHLHLI